MAETAPFSSDVLTIERAGHVATLWLDRPEKRNAMGPAFWRDLPLAMAELAGDPEVRAVVIAARGQSFTVGLDLTALADLAGGGGGGDGGGDGPSQARRAAALRAQVLTMQASINAVAECPKPVIAAVHSHCIGGGIDLISACDIRLCSQDAIFSVRETRMAIVADLGTLQRLPRVIPAGHAAELAFTGRDIDADRAARIGLVNDVYPTADALMEAAHALAAEIAANSPLVVQGTKSVLRFSAEHSVADGLEYVALWNAGQLVSDDLTEAVTAFMEKRPPVFRGR